jgi:hypothetical protein
VGMAKEIIPRSVSHYEKRNYLEYGSIGPRARFTGKY